MRPQRLEFTAIGSYAGTVVIDFDALAPFGLFHIHGPTGAGKSSLLDALCFALYGEVAPPRSTDRLRSDHAQSAVEAKASLDFSAQGVDYRIVRAPTQQRPKLRGEGTTKKWATAALLRRAGDEWEPVSSDVKEVDGMIKALVGLDARQFMQVVVLPQGAFAEALRANADEREKLLRTLFHTERFETYTERLRERADEARDRYDQDERELLHAAARIRELCESLELVLDWPENLCIDDDELACSRRAIAAVDDLLASKRVELAGAQEEVAQKDKQLQEVRVASEHWQRRIGATAKLAALDLERDEIDQVRDELVRADRVAPLLPIYQHDESVRERLADAASERGEQQGQLCASADALTWNPRLADVLRGDDHQAMQRALREHGTAHQDQLHAARAQQRERDRLAEAHRHREAAVAKLERVVAEQEAAAAAVESIQQQTEALRLLADQREAHEQTVSTLSAEATAAKQAKQLQEQVIAQRRVQEDSEKQALDLERRHLELLKQRVETMAAELAGQLRDGEACVVCGAVEHPTPAAPVDLVDESAVEEAQKAGDAARVHANEQRRLLDEVVARTQESTARAGSMASDLDAGLARLKQAKADLASAVEAQRALENQASALEKAAQEHIRLTELLQTGKNKVVELEANIASGETELARLVDAHGELDVDQIEAQQRVLDLLPALVDSLGQARQRESHLQEEAAQSAARLQAALKAAGIADVDALLADLRVEEQRQLLRDRLEEWTNARVAAEAVLADPLVSALQDAPPLDSVQQEAAEARAKLDGLLTTTSRFEAVVNDLQTTVERLQARAADLEPLRTERDRLVSLWQLCDGKQNNARRMSLERYVLAAYLEEVAAAASLRLQLMSAGRYRLRHSDEVAKRKVASGLTLLVSDAYTGIEREVSSLSGGETFLASLALALGLADVVQQHAGGVSIEALFVDEGFGSLDPETLDLAMAELDRLREGGRLVGVISHVGALRERIPVGIEVVKGTQGSTIKVTGLDELASA